MAESGEKPTLALKRRGIRYVELRSVDLGCAHPVGIDLEGLRFLELFMLHCLLAESPPFTGDDRKVYSGNYLDVACCGRTPGLTLRRGDKQMLLLDWAAELAEALAQIAVLLDDGDPAKPYQNSLRRLHEAVADPESTPSARILNELRSRRESFAQYGIRISSEHAQRLRAQTIAPERAQDFAAQSEESLVEQRRIEASDVLPFDEFLARYLSQA